MRKVIACLRALSWLAGLVTCAAPASAVSLNWLFVADADNPPDTVSNCFATDCGSVPYEYSISKFEITNEQYAEFLNAKAAADPLGLYNANMGSQIRGGIVRSGNSFTYTYGVRSGFANKPVNYVSFFDALRFVNWMHNDQANGDTETGAYTLLGGTALPSNWATVERNAGANVYLASENEWYKAAYYDAGTESYFDYPTGSNSAPTCSSFDGAGKRANCSPSTGDTVNDVGTYTNSASPYGTFDQGGNVQEWNDEISDGGSQRGRRGGDYNGGVALLASSDARDSSPTLENVGIGFRLTTLLPPVVVCDEPECEVLGSGSLVGGVSFGSTCTTWYVSLVIRDDPSQGFDFDSMPRIFDVPYSQAMEGVVSETGLNAPDFDLFAAELSDGEPDEIFLCYHTAPNLGGSGTCDSGPSGSGTGSNAESVIFGLTTVDFGAREVTTLRLKPTLACTFIAADIEALPEPTGEQSLGAVMLVLVGLAARRRSVLLHQSESSNG